jgi:drug/metabolite transporter (DMT)-like permease
MPPSSRPVTTAHLAQILFLGAVWGAAFLSLRIAAPEVGAVWAAEIRIAIGAAILLVLFGRRTWPLVRANPIGFIVAGAALSAIPFTLIAISALTLPVGFGAVLNATTPLFTAALAVAWLGERLSVRTIVGILVGIAAVVVLVGWSPLDPTPATILAALASLGAAFAYAFGGTFVKRVLPGVGGTELATGQLAAGVLLLLPFALASGAPRMPAPDGVVALLFVGVLSTALPWPIYLRLLRSTTPTIASSVTFVVPAFAITWGAMILGEPVGAELLVGFGIIIVSLVLVLGLRPRLPVGPLETRLVGLVNPRWAASLD